MLRDMSKSSHFLRCTVVLSENTSLNNIFPRPYFSFEGTQILDNSINFTGLSSLAVKIIVQPVSTFEFGLKRQLRHMEGENNNDRGHSSLSLAKD